MATLQRSRFWKANSEAPILKSRLWSLIFWSFPCFQLKVSWKVPGITRLVNNVHEANKKFEESSYLNTLKFAKLQKEPSEVLNQKKLQILKHFQLEAFDLMLSIWCFRFEAFDWRPSIWSLQLENFWAQVKCFKIWTNFCDPQTKLLRQSSRFWTSLIKQIGDGQRRFAYWWRRLRSIDGLAIER